MLFFSILEVINFFACFTQLLELFSSFGFLNGVEICTLDPFAKIWYSLWFQYIHHLSLLSFII